MPAWAQIASESRPVSVFEMDASCRVAGAYLVMPADEKPEATRAVEIAYSGAEGCSVFIEASDQDRKPVDVSEVGPLTYLVFGSGKVWVRLTALDKETLEFNVIKDVVEVGRSEPPEPEPTPDPKPEPGPSPMKADWLVFVEELDERTRFPEQTAVMMNPQLWKSVNDRGIQIRVYDDDQTAAKSFAEMAGDVRPAMILFQDAGNFRVFVVPKTAADAERIVRENVIR